MPIIPTGFPTPTMSHCELSSSTTPKQTLYSKALNNTNINNNGPISRTSTPIMSNSTTTTSDAMVAMPSPPMSPHPKISLSALASSNNTQNTSATPIVSLKESSSNIITNNNNNNNRLPSIEYLYSSSRFPHDFPSMKDADPTIYRPVPGSSNSMLQDLQRERLEMEQGPQLKEFGRYSITDNYSKQQESDANGQLVSCSWNNIRSEPSTYLQRERAFLSQYKRHTPSTPSYNVFAHSTMRHEPITLPPLRSLIPNHLLTSSINSPRRSTRKQQPPVYYDSDGMTTRSRNNNKNVLSPKKTIESRVSKGPSLPSISSLVVEQSLNDYSTPSTPSHNTISYQNSPEPFNNQFQNNSDTSSLTSPQSSSSSPIIKPKKTRKPREKKPSTSTNKSQPKERREKKAIIPSNVHEMSFENLPDYSPSVSTLNGQQLKAEWKGTPMDLSNDPKVDLLEESEVALAATLRLPAHLYLDSKRRLFAEKVHRLRQGLPFRRTDAQKACRIDVNKASRLFSAYEKVGWLDNHHFESFL